MASIEQELEVAALSGLQVALNQNEATVENIINVGEADLVQIVANGLKNLAAQKVGGIFGPEVQMIEGALDAALTAQAQDLVAKYGAKVIFAFLQHEVALALAAVSK